ncbi:hypothetical protein J31TS3_47390 [Paenibacillus lactis]|nr:hypothetical protein J31TS3_47390 [Paenibacillus lactis]
MIISTCRNYANARGGYPCNIAILNRKYESFEVEGNDKRQYWKKKTAIITPSYGMRKEGGEADESDEMAAEGQPDGNPCQHIDDCDHGNRCERLYSVDPVQP